MSTEQKDKQLIEEIVQSNIEKSNYLGLSYEDLETKPYIPLADNILVEMVPEPMQSAGGIILSTKQNEKRFARVVMPGTGRIFSNGQFSRLKVETGDYIELEPQFTQHYVERVFEGKNCYLIREADIRGVVVVDTTVEELRNRITNTLMNNE